MWIVKFSERSVLGSIFDSLVHKGGERKLPFRFTIKFDYKFDIFFISWFKVQKRSDGNHLTRTM